MCSLAFASCQVPASPYKVEDMSQEEFFFFFFLVAMPEEVCQRQR